MQIIIGGILKPDGTLELDGRPPLVPGRVRVIIENAPSPEPPSDALAVLEEIFAESDQASGGTASAEKIDSAIDRLREEWDERQRELERIQKECLQARQQTK